MSYFRKGLEVDLIEKEEDYIHKVQDLAMLSGLSNLDTWVQGNTDYPVHPHTDVVKCTCPKYDFYLRDIILKLKETRQGKISAVCSNKTRQHSVKESWADMLTFLAAASVSINIALEETIRHTDN